MNPRETLARLLTIVILIGMPALIVGYEYGLRPATASPRTIDITLDAPEAGGFQPNAITINVGDTITLRFRSNTLARGVAIGAPIGIDLGLIQPGHTQDVTLTFSQPGVYTFYCNIWCNPPSAPVRGTITVRDRGTPANISTPAPDPVMTALAAQGVNIDAKPARDNIPDMDEDDIPTGSDDDEGVTYTNYPENPSLFNRQPSAVNGQRLITGIRIPAELEALAWRRSHTPLQAVDVLALANPATNRDALIDVTAYLWARDIQASQQTAALYEKNCVGCHGESGDGRGPSARYLAKRPVTFTDLTHLFDMRSDVLYAKIRRGGWHTDMPEYGTIFTPEETWKLVDYLWQLAIRRAN